MTWALCIAAWWLVSVPVACLAVRLFRDDASATVKVAASLPLQNSDAGRSTPTCGSQAAGVSFNG